MEKHNSSAGAQTWRRSERATMQVREKVGKSRALLFPMFCGSGGSKSRLPKAAGAEPAGQMRDERVNDILVRRIFGSKRCQDTSVSENF